MKKLKPIMFVGTGSDVGKSLLAAGMCRILKQDGYSPAPFKAQNMALNSYATPEGKEIGRAQAVQAEAAGIDCHTDMNPVLLKPSGELTSQVIINGLPVGNCNAWEYFRNEGKEELKKVAREAFKRLQERFNPIVLEGAGSISELNLQKGDIVNMSMARYADANVILVADIDRGGVFASVYGSVMLQQPEDRKRIKGIIINKFRGDLKLFEEGRKIIEQLCGIPVLGVVPLASHFHIDEEDSVALAVKNKVAAKTDLKSSRVNVAVILLKHISNFTDFNRLEHHPDVNLFYANSPEDLEDAQIIILPGSKNTISDMIYLRKKGFSKAIIESRGQGKTIIGICGGYQMMGEEISDPEAMEGEVKSIPGLGLLPVKTVITPEKNTRQVKFRFKDSDEICEGYEIHMGETVSPHPFLTFEDGSPEGCMVDDKCFGSYIHGLLDNSSVIDFILKPYLSASEINRIDWKSYKETQYDLLASHLRKYLDIDRIYKIMENDD